ncbi:MAG: AraC family transcriptional regulator [Kofleriaceae bacterium]
MFVGDLIPVSVPGLRVVRSTIETLRVGMKEHYTIGRLEHGRSRWWAQGQVWTSGPGSIQLKLPGDVHRDLAHDGPITLQVVVLPSSDFERVRAEAKVAVHPNLAAGDERGRPFDRLHDAVVAGADRLSLEVAVTEAIAAFAVLEGAPDHTRPVRRAMEYLREHLGDPVTLADLAHHAGLDKFHLCRAFRAQIGMPPHAYLTHLRIARAKQLLDSGVRASEVAPRVGLYDQSQLNRHFRRIVGTTPGRYGNPRSTSRS